MAGNQPFLILNSVSVVNDNNGNGQLDPGENAGIVTYIQNAGNQTATNVQGRLRTSSPYVTITDSMYTYGNVAAGASANNISDPYDVQVSASTPNGTIAGFTLSLASAESTWTRPFSLTIGIAAGTIIWGPKVLPGYPSTGFIYGLAYDRIGNRIYVLNAYGRAIYAYSSDSNLTSLGSIAAPDTLCADISYSPYDDKLWVTGFNLKQIWKITKTGTVNRQFANPASDYPVGLAYRNYRLWCADRRSSLGATQYLYNADTFGTGTQYNNPVQGYYNSRCLAYDTDYNRMLQVHTWFNSSGTALDSAGIVEYQGTPPTLTGNRFRTPAGWNIRGIEYDPRDGNYWITIPQGATSSNMLVKVRGFHTVFGINERDNRAVNRVNLIVQPNPASDQVMLSFTLDHDNHVAVRIYDAVGRVVRHLDHNRHGTGMKRAVWDLKNDQGIRVADGIYFVMVNAGSERFTQKIVIAR